MSNTTTTRTRKPTHTQLFVLGKILDGYVPLTPDRAIVRRLVEHGLLAYRVDPARPGSVGWLVTDAGRAALAAKAVR